MKKRILFIILILSMTFNCVYGSVPGPSIFVGNISNAPFTGSYNVANYRTGYITHAFTLSIPMDIKITHEGLSTNSTYIYLYDGNGNRIYTDYYTGYLQKDELQPGTYYAESLFYDTSGTLKITIKGTASGSVITNPEGNKMSNAINIGTKNAYFVYSDEKDTNNFTDEYRGQTTNDVFYKFTLGTPMDISISHPSSYVNGSYIYLLDSSGNRISFTITPNFLNVEELAAGTYYIVSEGINRNGKITTKIEGSIPVPPNPPGNKMETAINLGSKSSSFLYSNTQDTNGFTNEYEGMTTNDVFYKFTLEKTMDVTISHCGSSVADTYVHLLNANGNRIAYNDDYGGPESCKPGQAYLKMTDLPAGTYYVVSEGNIANGNITTEIKGSTNPPGNEMRIALDLGSKSSPFIYNNTQNTIEFTDEFQGQVTNDVFYKFTLTIPMDVTISHCGSGVSDTYVHLLNSTGTRIAYNDNHSGEGACSNNSQAYLKMPQLAAGTYYVVSEGKTANGSITTTIEGAPNPPGNKMSTALDLGNKLSSFVYSNTQNTTLFTNDYTGQSTNDIFYRFTLSQPMDVTISHCGSGLSDTYLHLLNASGNRIAYNDNYSGIGACSNTAQAYLKMTNLAAGTYYVVSEGKTANGSITTTIEGIPNPPGNKMSTALDLGSKSSGFVYSNTQNTGGFTNDYQGQSTNDVFYKFTLTKAMDITISHCGSAVSDTYLHLLNSAGTRIAYNDNYYGEGACSNTAQAYLKVDNLEAGVYYIVSEGNSANGSITTTIQGVVPPPNPPGNKMSTALSFGRRSAPFIETDIQDTNGFTDEFRGQPTNDVFYTFRLDTPLDIIISHCGSGVADTHLYLLDVDGNQIAYNDNYSGEGSCSNTAQAYLKIESLPVGVYYIVSEGKTANGSITTRIEGSMPPPNPPGNKMNNALDLGSKSASFTYSDIQDTNGFTNEYNGQSTNDVFYKFTLTTPMHITISHCGSELNDTYLHLLNEAGTRIDYNDNYYVGDVCRNVDQSYLRKENLPAGTYYVVSEGKNANGKIYTYIEGEKYVAPNASTSQNYILTITPTVSTSNVDQITTDKALKTIQYFDGLGRPTQTVQVNASPDKSDIVTHQEYDSYGRESNAWLPVSVENNNGAFVPYANIVNKALVNYDNDSKAYSKPVYENSPLNRVLEQYGPGQDWHNNGKAVKTAYLANNSQYPCKLYTTSDDRATISITRASSTTNYADAQLYVTRLTDEDGNISYEFKDKLGQVVLTRLMEGAEEHDTYYIYDSYGNLRVVLPPLAADNLSAGTWDESNTYLQQYAYLYKYDSRNRCIAKKLPGADWIYNVYDKADRLIFTQDGEQRTRGEWTFNIFDVHGRAVLSGTCNNTLDYTAQLNSVVVGNWVGSESIYRGYEVNGVTLSNPKVLSVNFYDSYDFTDKNGIPSQYHSDFRYDGFSGFNDRYYTSEKGLHTGSLSALLDGAEEPTYLTSMMYYNRQGRMIQNHTQSHITNGIDKHYIRYSLTGEPVRSEHLHAGKDKPTVTEYMDYEYDHARRLQTSYHQLRYIGDLGERVALAGNSYDAVGRLKTKVFHGNAAQPVTYSYNIRGWLTGMANTHFTENLYYNSGNSEPLYNGNISSMTWKVGSESNMRGYKFDYDGLSRLTQATYGEGNLIANNANRFTEKVTGYDKHGNIMGLQRHGKTSSTGYGLIDNLTFGYTGNRMQYVNDAVTTSLADGTFHFVNGSNSTSNEYMYDANGNLIKDSNKNITNIAYNLLNLPSSVQLSDNRTATYLYDAAGMKRKVTHQGGGENKMTEYCSNVIYENKMFNKVLTDEGYLTVVNHRPIYHYYLKDHLGNNRVVLNQDGTTVEQVSHYYPFGGVFDQTAEDTQRYKYNGKELDRTYGLDLYDYSARYMDGALARFTTMDPMAEKYYGISPYAYCANNPMRFVDPTGMDWYSYLDEEGITQYRWSDEIFSQEDLNKINPSATYLGITHTEDNSYLSLFGQMADLGTREGRAIQKMDEAMIKKAEYLKEMIKDPEAIEKRTDFDIGSYLRTSALGLSEGAYFEFQYGIPDNGLGKAYYYNIAEGEPNSGHFESWGRDKVRGNSSWGNGNMKSGYNVLFNRKNGATSIRIVFPTLETKNKVYDTYRKILLKRKN